MRREGGKVWLHRNLVHLRALMGRCVGKKRNILLERPQHPLWGVGIAKAMRIPMGAITPKISLSVSLLGSDK